MIKEVLKEATGVGWSKFQHSPYMMNRQGRIGCHLGRLTKFEVIEPCDKWRVIVYIENQFTNESWVIKDRTEQEASKEAAADIAKMTDVEDWTMGPEKSMTEYWYANIDCGHSNGSITHLERLETEHLKWYMNVENFTGAGLRLFADQVWAAVQKWTLHTDPVDFSRWLYTYMDEKGIDLEHQFYFELKNSHIVDLGIVVDHFCQTGLEEQSKIKYQVVRDDLKNVPKYAIFEFYAKAIAEMADKAYG